MDLPSKEDLEIRRLGEAGIPSPLDEPLDGFVSDGRRVVVSTDLDDLQPFFASNDEPPCFEHAGPRQRVHFDPARLTAGIVTCGGLCPGLNGVIRSIVLTLVERYGVRRVLGFRYGYAGLDPSLRHDPIELTPEVVDRIHERGGTILGTSRGPRDLGDMARNLVERGVGVLFAIGGDGTLRGASALAGELRRRGDPVGVIGVPKTIDNDIRWTDRSFGFYTAVESARAIVAGADAEARSVVNGVGLVELMGRHSGFIAAGATLASSEVDFCLVPEFPVSLDGLLAALERRLDTRRHAVVVVAEGAGQSWFGDGASRERDASGNVKFADVGVFLRDRMTAHFAEIGKPISMKYFDPSYVIRSLPANARDSAFCLVLGQHAVHAAMSGRTDLMVGVWRGSFVHVPLALVAGRKELSVERWQRVLEATGQPRAL